MVPRRTISSIQFPITAGFPTIVLSPQPVQMYHMAQRDDQHIYHPGYARSSTHESEAGRNVHFNK